jgi:hypothetical protein
MTNLAHAASDDPSFVRRLEAANLHPLWAR